MSIKTRKVAIIGAGHVGSHCGFSLATRGICDEILMIDKDEKKALSQAMDLTDAVSYLDYNIKVKAGSFGECNDADIVVISVGPLPDMNQTRLDTLNATIKEVSTIIKPIVSSGFDGIFIVISNPVDVIAYYVAQESGFPNRKVIGTGTALDSARLRRILSYETGIAPNSIVAYSMGEHGDSQMIPWSKVSILGKPLLELIEEKPNEYETLDLNNVLQDTIRAGWSILEGKGSTEFGIATSLSEMVKAIFHDDKKVMPCSTYLRGKYNQENVYASVPAVIGKHGVEEIVELKLTYDEQQKFASSCDVIREYISKIK